MRKTKRRIKNAYDAYWFLHEHPKLQIRERSPETKRGANRKIKGTRIITDACGFLWREWKLLERRALTENLDIHYAAVDERGRINENTVKNVHRACWLELGPMQWGYNSKPEWEKRRCYIQHAHDIDLDCGADTFDEALIKLAKLVQKKYGDFPVEAWQVSG